MHVVVDANVLISFFYERNAAQRQAAKELLQRAENGELVVVLPQVVLLEMTHVCRNLYGVPAGTVAEMTHAAITFPGAVTIDDCPWREVLRRWPDSFSSVADAITVALAITPAFLTE
ncbi:MAG TPA: PIN domain-containing protein [Thermoanaerobaculia bacterium]|nr:PIN domain-containing protein [Thermoanaerobaculia bacterium]